jgi:hypothetical protein
MGSLDSNKIIFLREIFLVLEMVESFSLSSSKINGANSSEIFSSFEMIGLKSGNSFCKKVRV